MSIFSRVKLYRARSARVAVAAALVAGGAVVVTPAVAMATDVGTNCDGDVSMGRSATRVVNDLAIKVNGITYGRFNVGLYNYNDNGTLKYLVKYAVKDARSDGMAPYIRNFETDLSGSTNNGNLRIINRRGAASGWVCTSIAGLSNIKKITVRGSVADQPSIPEPIVAEITY